MKERDILKVLVLAAALSFVAAPAFACEVNIEDFAGYTIVTGKTIVGYFDEGGERKESFEGCAYGRTIVFDDNTGVKCTGYGYLYAYRPTASFLVNGSSIKMCVENELFDVTQP